MVFPIDGNMKDTAKAPQQPASFFYNQREQSADFTNPAGFNPPDQPSFYQGKPLADDRDLAH